MKTITKLFFLTALFLTLNTASYGQITFGPRIGLNLSTVLLDDMEGAKLKPGLHIGGYVRIGSEKVGFQPEVLFSMKGYKYSLEGFTQTQSLNYLDVPLLGTFGKNFKFLVGVQPSFLLSAKYKEKEDGEDPYEDNSKEGIRTVDVAGILGFEYELNMGLNFGYRLGFGFLPVYDGDYIDGLANNINMQLTVGYTIGKDK